MLVRPSAPSAGRLGGRGGPAFERRLLLAAVRHEGLAGPEGIVRRTVTVTASRTHPNRNFDQIPVIFRSFVVILDFRSDSRSQEAGRVLSRPRGRAPAAVGGEMPCPKRSRVADKVGSVSANRYAEIVAELRKLVETASPDPVHDRRLRAWSRADARVRRPGAERGAVHGQGVAVPPGRGHRTVLLSSEGAPGGPLRSGRRTARAPRVSFTVHKILAAIADDEERFTTILNPPEGKARWTPDEANRAGRPAGRQTRHPAGEGQRDPHPRHRTRRSPPPSPATCCGGRRWSPRSRQEDKVRAVEELTREDQVAAEPSPGTCCAARRRRPGRQGGQGQGRRGTDPRRDTSPRR